MKGMRHIACIAAAVSLAVGCIGPGGNSGKVPAGPEAVVTEFNRALLSGDFDKAYAVCDSLGMEEYIESYREKWNETQKRDSSAHAIVAGMLDDAAIEITGTEKDGEIRHIAYTLDTGDRQKARKATVSREGGEWKVKKITDAI